MVFEGGDGAGKSTQIALLAEALRAEGAHEVVVTREPGGTPLGRQVRELLLHGDDVAERAEALLFAADRAHHVATVIRPGLERGAVVVSDRYVDSSIAYQGARDGLPVDDVAGLSRWATDGLVPDLTVLLDVSPQTRRERRGGGGDRMETAGEDFHDKVRRGFLDLAEAEPGRYLVLPADDSVEPLHQRILSAVRGRLGVQ